MRKVFSATLFALGAFLFSGVTASAAERLCDVSFEDCRAPLVKLIQSENKQIDVAFWFMDDSGIASALTSAKNRGVIIRMMVDPRADEAHLPNETILAQFASAGFP